MTKWQGFPIVSVLVSVCSAAAFAATASAREQELSLTKDGKPQASIVISAQPTQPAVFAALELRDHIEKISGARLPIMPDTDVVGGTRILVGESVATRKVGLNNGDFKNQEYLIGVRGSDLALMGRDGNKSWDLKVGNVHNINDLRLSRSLLPDPYDGEGTCYAVYDFLEKSCGVRWYGPTEICSVIPKKPTLKITVHEVRRTPTFAFRNIMPVYMFDGSLAFPAIKELWGYPSADEMWLYMHRMRNGGEKFANAGHSFYGFPDRFWHRNPKNEAAWEGQHLEWFSHGYESRPTQLCYNNDGVISQVVADARAFFDGKRLEGGVGNFYVLGPGDDVFFCLCPACRKQFNEAETSNEHFSNGKYSEYWFGFCNKVAREIRKTHPDKYLSVQAYMSWAKHPSFRLEPNMTVQLAMGGNTYLDDPSKCVGSYIQGIYREWVEKEKGRPLYLWIYAQFPESQVWSPGFTAFPGFGTRLIAKQIKMYAKDGIRGIFTESTTTQLNEYMYNQMALDATQDPERILDEFFALYYGAAAAPMRKLWLEIEETYSNPANWPVDRTKGDKDIRFTEEISWKYLGTAERMAHWAGYMDEARRLAQTDIEKARVRLFEHGEWNGMVNGRRIWENKEQHAGEVEQLKQSPPPSIHAPAISNAAGDLAKVDWTKAGRFAVTRIHEGYPAERQISVEIAHDANYLYMRLSDPMARDRISSDGGAFDGDRWEIFLGARRGASEYFQFGIKPDGRLICYAYPRFGQEIETGARVTSQLTEKDWVTSLAAPLKLVRNLPQASVDALYLNIYRPASAGQATLAWSPNFAGNGFNTSERLGSVILDK